MSKIFPFSSLFIAKLLIVMFSRQTSLEFQYGVGECITCINKMYPANMFCGRLFKGTVYMNFR